MLVTECSAHRIERAEVEVTRLVASTGRAVDAFWRPVGSGAASFVRPHSPLNKVIGVGLDAAIDERTLAIVEVEMRARHEPVRVELATLAIPASGELLTGRGYRLLGFENVLVRSLEQAATRLPHVHVERVTPENAERWRAIAIEASACSDESGVPVDDFSRDTLADAIDDMLAAPGIDRYLAFIDDNVAGAASMLVHDAIAQLGGSATLSAFRRRGIQAALIDARLDDARARGADLATVTTAPGSISQANVMKRGFVLGYARAILSGATSGTHST
jgi:GNAT superfamily N-acetyltransferase